MKNMVALIDTDVLADCIIKREPFFKASKAVIDLRLDNKYRGFITGQCIPNLFYILRKNFSDKERREILLALCNLFSICQVDQTIIIGALRESNFKDFEDCIQSQCAVYVNADYIVTRNIKDFTNSKIKAITPNDFINLF